MNRNFDITLIRTFAAVADQGSMTVAANMLHMTQGAVSQQIKRLEDMLGCALFERDRRGLRLTEAGERLLGNARRLLTLNDEIWDDMTERPVRGSVRLGVPYDLVGATLATLGMPVNAERVLEPIPAELLLGEDGTVRAVRMVSPVQ